ncbi:alpha/beta-hydrolase family protein [Antrihabitans sp. YC3-6]|uniref:Alpha/beta-hydrolase family protein n=1 Tax=Antrihabitans stalagmiti TaxID=2799499 RepID=A0A934NN20_9NOCA|nr:alpha/beta-hydrolase family protein [Antrihabitans stalagmiti]MBJ8338165.1 alpha/beta-hydrolase family protein [Antrihabitans stalagmiti]
MTATVSSAVRPLQHAKTLAGSLAIPRVEVSVGVTAMVLVSLAPGLLPRAAAMQAVLSGMLGALGLVLAALLGFALRTLRVGPAAGATRRTVTAVGIGTVVISALGANEWQNRLRSAMSAEQIGAGYWIQVAAGSALIMLLLYVIAAALRALARRLGIVRGVTLAIVGTAAAVTYGVPVLVDWRTDTYRAANAEIDSSLHQPDSATRSGSPYSFASWQALGAEGRKFVATATNPGTDSVRVYAGIDSAADLHDRVAIAVDELQRSGGFERSNIVVAIPTGSGWIDDNAVQGFETRFGGDVAIVGVQYSYAPSWATFVFGRSAAEESARTLYTAVADRVAQLPIHDRPKLYLYGQSLGAIGGSAALAGGAVEPCGALWAGPPAGGVEREGATILANSSDPVVRWSSDLLFHRPEPTGTHADAPMPPWLPVVSFVQTTVDLLSALDAPAGHGHRYGTEQGTAMPGCE